MKKAGGFIKRMVAVFLSGMMAAGTIPGIALATEIQVQENTVQEEAITTYTVILDANGGHFENEWDDVLCEYIEFTEILNKLIPVGGTIETVPVLEQENAVVTFLGWSLERDAELVSLEQEMYSPAGDCTLYAVWKIEELEDFSSDENITEESEDDTSSDLYTVPETEKDENENSDAMATNQQDDSIDKGDANSDETEQDKNEGLTYDSEEGEKTDPTLIESSNEKEKSVRRGVAKGVVASGECGENVIWTLDEEGTLTISGTGNTTNATSANAIFRNYTIKKIIIKDGVTSIGNDLFLQCRSLTSVTIPNSVTSIGFDAFRDCTSLTSITIPNSVTIIREAAFCNCTSLTSVTIPNSVTCIGDFAFSDCINLSSVIIPSSVSEITIGAFGRCSSLTSIYFQGDAPTRINRPFINVTATAYYPTNNSTWTEDVRQNYGGTITWVPWNPLFSPVEPVHIVNGTSHFRSGLANDDTIKYTFNYDDNWAFSNDWSDRYKLMQASMRVAMAAFGSKEDNWFGPSNIRRMMSTMGFSFSDKSIEYPEPNKEDVNTIGSAIGLKNIMMQDGTVRSIILVAIRGGGYGAEWGGNFRVGANNKIDSIGFRAAADQVDARLRSFIETNRESISENLRIWVTGFSRGGATSNLVAADLINGTCAIQGISSTDVMGFCFECPKTTTDSRANASMYNNIISVVNPNDFVPKVPMKMWGFSRYGQTLYIPSAETTNQFTKRFKQPMIKKYSALFETNGIPVNNDVVVEKIGQASLLDSFFDHLAFCIPRKAFEAAFQDSIVDITASCLGNAGSPDWKAAVPSMLGVLEVALLRPKSTIEVTKLFTKGNTGPGPNSHYPELCMSWIDSLSGYDNYISEENSLYRRVLINCPVNVTVKNSSGEIVGRIVNDEIEEIEDGIVARIDEDGQKTFVLPQDEEYTVEVQGTDEGTVNYTVEDYNFDTNTTEKVINYKEIEISEGTEIVGTISEAENTGETETTLHLKEDQEAIEPDEVLTGDEVISYSVEVSSAGNGNVFGGGSYVKGEFAKITAEADEGFEFSGWYKDDECVSTEYEYRFAVADNTSLTAVFIPEILISFENESITLNTGKTAVLNVSISSPDVELAKCKWSSSDQNVANVDEKGTVTTQTPGMTVITVTTEDGKHSASCNVSVKGLIENADISGISDMTYSGEELSHNLIIRDGNNSLTKDIDYYVEYSDSINAGTATVTISGIGKYEGIVTKTFTINPASIANATLSGISSKIYTGKVQTQNPIVKIRDKTLVNDTDYFLTYTNNTNAGTATITITGTGNYSGTKEETFTINKAAQSLTVKSTATSIAVGKTATVSITGAKGTKSFKSSNTAIATVNSSTGVVTGKKAGTVTITATSAATSNYNAASKTVKITVTAGKSLKKPGNCHFAKWNNAKYTSCQIAWNKVAGADGYQTLLSWTNGTHASATIVQSNVLYRNCTVHPQHVSQMKVRAFYTEGGKRVFGPWSNIEYITPSPAKLTAKNAGSGSNVRVNISWNIIYGCNGYNVFITTNPNGTWYWNQSTSTNATATSAVITKYRGSGLKKNTRYYVRIVTRRKRNGVFCTVPMPAKNTYVGSFIIK